MGTVYLLNGVEFIYLLRSICDSEVSLMVKAMQGLYTQAEMLVSH